MTCGCYPQGYVTGTPVVKRRCEAETSIFVSLVRQEAEKRDLDVDKFQFIVAHLDEEIQLGALIGLSVVDVLQSLDEGPFALRQSGGLPFDSVLDLCMAHDEREQVLSVLHEKGGLSSYLGVQSLQEAWEERGEYADLIREALVYQIGKEIGALATVLKGQVDGILLGGELVKYDSFIEALKKRIEFVAPISLYPGKQILPQSQGDKPHTNLA